MRPLIGVTVIGVTDVQQMRMLALALLAQAGMRPNVHRVSGLLHILRR